MGDKMDTVVDTEDQLKMLLIEEGYCQDGEEDDYFDDNYQGQFDSLAEYARDFFESTGTFGKQEKYLEQLLDNYFDYESWARDCESCGDIFTITLDHELHFFIGN